MENIYVADSYKDWTIISEPFENEKGYTYVRVEHKCGRCIGGIYPSRIENGLPVPYPVDGGVCYKCGGTGKETKVVRAYTEKEYIQNQKAKERAKQKKEEDRALRIKERIDNAEKYKAEIAEKLGFNAEGYAYIVYGGDTFKIKDELKKLGAKYNPALNWYFNTDNVELPEKYAFLPIAFDDVYEYHPAVKRAAFKENAKEIVKEKLAEVIIVPETEFYPAAEKERLRDLDVTFDSVHGFDGLYGYTNIYTFKAENYVFVWMTAKALNLTTGEKVKLTGTIKKFNEYNGIKQTILSRCIVKNEED